MAALLYYLTKALLLVQVTLVVFTILAPFDPSIFADQANGPLHSSTQLFVHLSTRLVSLTPPMCVVRITAVRIHVQKCSSRFKEYTAVCSCV